MSAAGDGGFGYDPLFVPDDQAGRSAAELPAALKNRVSHRAQALAMLVRQLQQAPLIEPN
jgi:XTP/dITP diphosphohydrolase